MGLLKFDLINDSAIALQASTSTWMLQDKLLVVAVDCGYLCDLLQAAAHRWRS